MYLPFYVRRSCAPPVYSPIDAGGAPPAASFASFASFASLPRATFTYTRAPFCTQVLEPKIALPNEQVLQAGEVGDYFYIIEHGRLLVTIAKNRTRKAHGKKAARAWMVLERKKTFINPEKSGAVVSRLSDGDTFGHSAMLRGRQQNNVYALTYANLLMLHADKLDSLAQVYGKLRENIKRLAKER